MFDGLDDAYPLTPLQQGILYETLKAPDTDVYVAYILIDIVGAVDRNCLFNAWEKVAAEFTTLRSRFVWESLDEPLQLVNTTVELCWHDAPCSIDGNEMQADSEAVVERYLSEERQTPLAISDTPPMRFRLIELTDEHKVLIWTIHHLLADDWSTPQVLQRVAYHLQSPTSKPQSEPLAFSQYVSWLTDADQTKALNWWRQQLRNAAPTPITVEAGLSCPVQSAGQARRRVEQSISADVSRAMHALAQGTGTTISVVAHAAWALVVSRYAGTSSALFGTSVSGRSNGLPGITDAVGLFLNTLPTYIVLDSNESITDYLERVKAQLFDQIRYEHVPLTQLVGLIASTDSRSGEPHSDRAHGELDDSTSVSEPLLNSSALNTSVIKPELDHSQAGSCEFGRPLFDSVLVVEAHGRDLSIAIPNSSAAFENIRYVTDSNYPLSVLVFPGDPLHLQLIASSDHFPQAILSAMATELTDVLADLCSGALQSVAELLRRQELRTRTHYPYQALHEASAQASTHVLIDDWITERARNQSQQIAVIDQQQSYHYKELLIRAQQVANELSATGTSGYVGLCLERGVEQIVAILGVLLSGCAYVPLDPRWPLERRTHVVNSAHIDVIVTIKALSDKIGTTSCTLILLDDSAIEETATVPDKHHDKNATSAAGIPLHGGNKPDSGNAQTSRNRHTSDAAYMIYTSGSTGEPKGVPISHANLLYSTSARFALYDKSPGCFLLLSPYTFDSSVAGIYWTLCSGGTLVMHGNDGAQDVHEIVEQIHRHSVTHTLCLPSVYALILRFGLIEKLRSLQCVIVAGESCPGTLIALHQEALPHTTLFNEYGPTEGTVWSTVSQLSNQTETVEPTDQSASFCKSNREYQGVAIGRAIPGTQVRVVDAQAQTVPRGVAGELQIIGPGVATAYHDDEKLSQQRFKPTDITHTESESVSHQNRTTATKAYCTGDIAVLGVDDQLYFLGRADRQIKIRGHRIEPAEIESHLLLDERGGEAFCCLQTPDSHLASHTSGHVSTHVQLASSGAQLCCFYTLRNQPSNNSPSRLLNDEESTAMRHQVEASAAESIGASLPAHFKVARFAAMTGLPTLSNGKIDVSELPALFHTEQAWNTEPIKRSPAGLPIDHPASIQGTSDQSSVMTPTISTLCDTLAPMIGRASVQPLDNYFSLGGDSLTAIRYVAACREKGLPLTIPMISEYSSLAELGTALDQNNKAEAVAVAVADYGPTPLSPIQRWFFASMSVNTAHWNMAFCLTFPEPIHTDQLHSELLDVLKTHRVLATRFSASDDGVSALIPQIPSCDDWLHVTPDSDISLTEHLLILQSEFSLEAGQLLRVSIKIDADDCCRQLGIVVHHLVTDAVSNWLLAHQLMERFNQSRISPPRPDLSRPDLSRPDHPRQNDSPPGRHAALVTSFRQWAMNLPSARTNKVPDTDLFVVAATSTTLPIWQEDQVQTLSVTIKKSIVRQLNNQVKAVGGEIHEWLLYLLVRSLPAVASVSLDIETHGRDDDQGVDIGASIGWFTNFFRLELENPEAQVFADFVQQFRTSKALKGRAFPEPGPDYFGHTHRRAESLPIVLYNFLAMTSPAHSDNTAASAIQFQPLLDPGFRHSQSRRSHAIELIVTGVPEGLSVLWKIDAAVARQWDCLNWRDQFQECLEMTPEYGEQKTELSLSEAFPDSGLSDGELDDFLSSLE